MKTINLTKLSKSIAAYNQCNPEWKERALDRIIEMCKDLPHGSGIDAKCDIDIVQSKEDRIVFYFEYHHMDENGYYSGWTEHNLILTPTFGSFRMRLTGRDKNGSKDYLYQLWYEVFCVNENSIEELVQRRDIPDA